jgi:hypothetical protein
MWQIELFFNSGANVTITFVFEQGIRGWGCCADWHTFTISVFVLNYLNVAMFAQLEIELLFLAEKARLIAVSKINQILGAIYEHKTPFC